MDVKSENNPADMLTKIIEVPTFVALMSNYSVNLKLIIRHRFIFPHNTVRNFVSICSNIFSIHFSFKLSAYQVQLVSTTE